MFCCTLLYVHSSIAIILMGKRELVALLSLYSWCRMVVWWIFLAVPRSCLQFVIVVFPDHTYLLFYLVYLYNIAHLFGWYCCIWQDLWGTAPEFRGGIEASEWCKLKLSLEKTVFSGLKVSFLGHLVFEYWVSLDTQKQKSVQKMACTNEGDWSEVICWSLFIHAMFIRWFSMISKPLHELTQKGVKFV